MTDTGLAFNPDQPPLMADVRLSDILQNKIVSGTPRDSTGVFQVDPWYWLRCAGGQLVHVFDGVPVNPVMAAICYYGISTPERGNMLNPGNEQLPATNAPVIIGANIRQTLEWHLVEGPIVYASDQVIENLHNFSTATSTLQTFEQTLELSVEATVGASGLGMSASVTAGLRDTVTTGIQTQNSIEQTWESKKTETLLADYGYATWVLYNKIEITYGADILTGPQILTHQQLAGINPGVITYYVPQMPWEDKCAKADLAAGELATGELATA